MQRIQREMDRLISRATIPYSQDFPAIDVWVSENDAIITAEMPGIDPQAIEISLKGDSLSLSGSRSPEELKEGEAYHRQERAHGRFSRSLRLPFQVDPGKVTAKYEKGVLTIDLPRAEEDKPRKIQIKKE
ncbi:MAG: Hsp20/alpha crystallin family protein [Syntrophales bacterium]